MKRKRRIRAIAILSGWKPEWYRRAKKWRRIEAEWAREDHREWEAQKIGKSHFCLAWENVKETIKLNRAYREQRVAEMRVGNFHGQKEGTHKV